MNKVLLVIEPWSCHYEVFPSVINSSSKVYDHIFIYVQDPVHLSEAINKDEMNATQNLTLKRLNNLVQDIEKIKSNGIYLDIWVNTSHVHGNQQSFTIFQKIYFEALQHRFKGRLFLVIHNKHDLNFIKYLQHNQVDKKVIPVCLSKDTLYKYMLNENSAKLFEPYTLKIEINQKVAEDICYDKTPIKLLIIYHVIKL